MKKRTQRQRLVLASGSPRRRRLLGLLGVGLDVVAAEVDERVRPGETPRAHVLRLAAGKAAAAAARRPGAWVLGADTVVVLGGRIMGKPSGEAQARRMLGRLSGRTHRVYTGVALVHGATGRARTACAVTRVTMRRFTGAEARAYAATGEPLDKAGAYGIQGIGGLLVERIGGSASNVVGLPLDAVVRLLLDAGLIVPSGKRGRMYEMTETTRRLSRNASTSTTTTTTTLKR